MNWSTIKTLISNTANWWNSAKVAISFPVSMAPSSNYSIHTLFSSLRKSQCWQKSIKNFTRKLNSNRLFLMTRISRLPSADSVVILEGGHCLHMSLFKRPLWKILIITLSTIWMRKLTPTRWSWQDPSPSKMVHQVLTSWKLYKLSTPRNSVPRIWVLRDSMKHPEISLKLNILTTTQKPKVFWLLLIQET